MTTPEGKIKREIDRILDDYLGVYVEKPVPSGYGKSGLDYSCCVDGHALYIEAKAPGEQPKPRQKLRMVEMLNAFASVFIISGPDGLKALDRYLRRRVPRKD